MPRERNAFRLGLALIVFFVLLVGVLVFLAPKGGGDMTLDVRFPIEQVATSLKPGGEVFCGGSTVGAIRAVTQENLPDASSGYERLYTVVAITLDSSLGLRKDCKIIPEGLLLGGVGKLTIVDRGVGEPVQPGEKIDGQPADDLSSITRQLAAQLNAKDPTSLLAMIKSQLDAADEKSLLSKIHDALEDINAVTQSLRREFNPAEQAVLMAKLHAILDNVTEVTRRLRDEVDTSVDEAMIAKLHQTLDTLNRGLGHVVVLLEDNREPITEAVGHIRDTSRILEEQIAARIAQQLDVSDAASLLAKVHVSLDRFGEALADVRAITGAARETIVLNKEQLGRMIGNLKEMSDHLNAASKDIRRSPWRVLYQPKSEEVAQANVFDAARAFSEAATRVDDAIARLQALSEAGGAGIERDDPVLLTILEDLEQRFADFGKAEEALWEQLEIK